MKTTEVIEAKNQVLEYGKSIVEEIKELQQFDFSEDEIGEDEYAVIEGFIDAIKPERFSEVIKQIQEETTEEVIDNLDTDQVTELVNSNALSFTHEQKVSIILSILYPYDNTLPSDSDRVSNFIRNNIYAPHF
jgi:hypothetical protein